jgi:hypothetical protein
MKIYIAGAITGHDLEERKRIFATAAQAVTEAGHTPVNPLELDHDHDKRWESYMKVCIIALIECDAIYHIMDAAWGKSRGVRMEYFIAQEMGLRSLTELEILKAIP